MPIGAATTSPAKNQLRNAVSGPDLGRITTGFSRGRPGIGNLC
jgi:hypothetical protein